MFCSKCGREIQKEDLFCRYCGAENVMAEMSEAQNEDSHQEMVPHAETGKNYQISGILLLIKNHKKMKYIITALLIVLAVSAFITGIRLGRRADSEDEIAEISVQETEKEKIEEEIVEGDELETEEVEEEAPYELLVCVPVEYMSLRKTPGLGEDVIAELEAGTYLKWYGESTTDNEVEFYKVTVRESGQEGYVSAKFCVKIEYEPKEDELIIVETDTALYTYDMMVEDIKKLCSMYPDRLSYEIIGESSDYRDIYEVILGNPMAENHIMMQAAIHGREYMTTQLVMKMLEYYSYYYETAQYDQILYKDLFEQTAIHIVPMSNPDGVTISQLGVGALNDSYFADAVYECFERDRGTLAYEEDSNGDMNWNDHYQEEGYDRNASGHTREITFEEYQTIWKANAYGVDLNNNFDAGWEEIELKQFPAYGSFKGYYPLSETESQALAELALQYDYCCFISYHSRGQLIYYDVAGNTEEVSQASFNFADLLENWIKYEPVNTNKGYNVNLGGFGDWVQLCLNKPSVTIESGKRPCPLEIEEFPAIWYRHRESWAMLCEQFYNKF